MLFLTKFRTSSEGGNDIVIQFPRIAFAEILNVSFEFAISEQCLHDVVSAQKSVNRKNYCAGTYFMHKTSYMELRRVLKQHRIECCIHFIKVQHSS